MTFRTWLRAILIASVLLLGASLGISRALRSNAARRYLLTHLTAGFGRPVEVSRFDFSLLDGIRIEAHSVSVAEDPHFGNEYFLRADTLTAGLRWRALLAGRFEFGSVSLLRPSLNLVRDAEGRWNIESWLPPAPSPAARSGFVGPAPVSSKVRAARLTQIDVDAGRINFKQQDNKIAFALAGVSGRIEQDSAGQWQLDVEAHPMRAGVTLQDIGTIRLRGEIAGTTARLQPAELHLTWRAASLADALRLAHQDDLGMRGEFAVDLDARVASPDAAAIANEHSVGARWAISGVARFTGIHGWRLPERETDPAANLAAEVIWQSGESRAEIQKLVLEMPGSRLQGAGDLEWSHGFHPQLRMASSTLAIADILSWYRALRPGVAEDLRADGDLEFELAIAGWPIQLQQGSITSAGTTLTAKSLPAPLRTGALRASISHGELDLAPAEISFVPLPLGSAKQENEALRGARQSFVLRGSLLSEADGAFRWPPNYNVFIEGSTARLQDWLSLSSMLGEPINSGWNAEGGVAVKVRGVRQAEATTTSWLGTVDFLRLTLSPALVNQPLRFPKAHVEFTPLQRTITLSGAEALGSVWRGSITRRNSDAQWTFDLSADRLDVAELDRWLGPRARPGFFARIVGLQSAPNEVSTQDAFVTRIAASGRLRADVIDMPPMELENFDGQIEVAGRTIRIRNGQADFFGGKVSGSFVAKLQPDPSYEFKGQFDHVNLSRLGHSVAILDNRIGGNLSASLSLSAHGIGRANLIATLEGTGTLNGRNVELRGFNLADAFPDVLPGAAAVSFAVVQGKYRVRSRGIDLQDLALTHSKEQFDAEGRIDFTHALNIRIRPSMFQTAAASLPASPPNFLLAGTIENPRLVLPSAPSSVAAKADTRGK